MDTVKPQEDVLSTSLPLFCARQEPEESRNWLSLLWSQSKYKGTQLQDLHWRVKGERGNSPVPLCPRTLKNQPATLGKEQLQLHSAESPSRVAWGGATLTGAYSQE